MTSLAFGPSIFMGGNAPNAVITLVHAEDTSANTNTPTFAGASIGTASEDRLVVVGVSAGTGGADAITDVTMTIGGNAATVPTGSKQSLTQNGLSAFAYLAVPSGATADIIPTFTVSGAGTVARSAILIWIITGLRSLSPLQATGGVNNVADTVALTASINTHPGGAAIGYACTPLVNSTWTWSGLTEDDDNLIAGEAGSYTGASLQGSGGGHVTASATNATSSVKTLSVISFR